MWKQKVALDTGRVASATKNKTHASSPSFLFLLHRIWKLFWESMFVKAVAARDRKSFQTVFRRQFSRSSNERDLATVLYILFRNIFFFWMEFLNYLPMSSLCGRSHRLEAKTTTTTNTFQHL